MLLLVKCPGLSLSLASRRRHAKVMVFGVCMCVYVRLSVCVCLQKRNRKKCQTHMERRGGARARQQQQWLRRRSSSSRSGGSGLLLLQSIFHMLSDGAAAQTRPRIGERARAAAGDGYAAWFPIRWVALLFSFTLLFRIWSLTFTFTHSLFLARLLQNIDC